MSSAELLARLTELGHRDAVRVLVARYCRICDGMDDQSEMAELFIEDAILVNPRGEAAGRRSIVDYYRTVSEETAWARHNVVNQVIEIVDAGVARHRAYFVALSTRAGGSNMIMGHYDDELRLTESGWRFAVKRNFIDKVFGLPQGWI